MKQVETVEDLKNINADDNVSLRNDINLHDKDVCIEEFAGEFNGNGHTIRNSTGSFFNFVEGTVRNVIFENVKKEEVERVSINEDLDEEKSKGIIKECEQGTLKNIQVTGHFSSYIAAGGVVGRICGGELINCSFTGTVTGRYSAGGIAGICINTEITNCHSNARIISKEAGGFLGNCKSSRVKNSACTGTVISTANSSGFCPILKNSNIKQVTFNGTLVSNTEVSGFSGLVRNDTEVVDCEVNCIIQNCSIASGFVTNNYGYIKNSVSKIKVKDTVSSMVISSSNEKFGGLVCENFGDGLIENCFSTVNLLADITTEVKLAYKNIGKIVDNNIRLDKYTSETEEKDKHTVEIYTGDDLQNITPESDVILCDDITVDTYILQQFNGTFNGNGYTVNGLQTPLFLKCNGVVKNTTFRNCSLTVTFCNMGVVCGINNGSISDVTVKDSQCSTTPIIDSENVGGICGLNKGEIHDSSFTGEITVSDSCGGITGKSIKSTLENCTVSGKIHSEYRAGGIVGVVEETNVIECVNKSTVQGGTNIGGIIGVNNNRVYDSTVEIEEKCVNCVNEGVIKGESYVGGIVGSCKGGIVNCINENTVSAVEQVGGIAGRLLSSKVLDCGNKAEVSGTSEVGGIAGLCSSIVESCINIEPITGERKVGGICGRITEDSLLKNIVCSSLTKGEKITGGIAGTANTINFVNVYSVGDVKADESYGPICSEFINEITTAESVFWNCDTCTTSKIGTESQELTESQAKTLTIL